MALAQMPRLQRRKAFSRGSIHNRCSIYEHRPFACRRLVNLDANDILCQLIPGHQVPVPYADGRALDAVFFLATSTDRFADIRDWFPAGR